MATDLIQRAAAICGIDNPNSDQLAAWLADRRSGLNVQFLSTKSWWAYGHELNTRPQSTLLESLAAAVVEVDRIEREASK